MYALIQLQDIGSLVCVSRLNELLKTACKGEKKDVIITNCDKGIVSDKNISQNFLTQICLNN